MDSTLWFISLYNYLIVRLLINIDSINRDYFRKKKATFSESPKADRLVPSLATKSQHSFEVPEIDPKVVQNGSITKQPDEKKPVPTEPPKTEPIPKPETPKTDTVLPNSIPEPEIKPAPRKQDIKTPEKIEKPIHKDDEPKPIQNTKLATIPDKKILKTADSFPQEHYTQKRRSSMKSDGSDKNESYCHRRVSVPSNPNLTLPTRGRRGNNDFSGHMVAKSELWDTGNQHRCSKAHQKRVSVSQPEDCEGKNI